jgi:hypothetical protein
MIYKPEASSLAQRESPVLPCLQRLGHLIMHDQYSSQMSNERPVATVVVCSETVSPSIRGCSAVTFMTSRAATEPGGGQAASPLNWYCSPSRTLSVARYVVISLVAEDEISGELVGISGTMQAPARRLAYCCPVQA